MVLTALFAKISARDPTVFSAWEVLRMATIEGAQAVGLGDEVGSLEEGKPADLILIDLTELNLTPVLETPVSVPAMGGSALDEGKYIVIWKLAGGQWMLHHDILNSSKPAQG